MPTFDQSVASRIAVGQALGETAEGVIGGIDPGAVDPEELAADPAFTGAFPSAAIGYHLLTDYGTVDTTGVTDCTATLNAALAAVYAAGGGTLVFPAGDILIEDQIVLPDDGGGIFGSDAQLGVPIVWRGQGGWVAGQRGASFPAEGGTRLVLTYDGEGTYNNAKIVTRGLGQLALLDMTFADTTANADTPFLFTTNTTLRVERCAFIGATSGTSCQQDAIVLGGTTKPMATGYDDPDSAFQGYGTVIAKCYFERVRRAVYGRSYCNQTQIAWNMMDKGCGTNLAGGASIEIDGSLDPLTENAGDYCTNNLIQGNYFHAVGGFAYAVKIKKGYGNVILGNGFIDPGDNKAAIARFEGVTVGVTDYRSLDNWLIANTITHITTQISEDTMSDGRNFVLGGIDEPARLPSVVELGGTDQKLLVDTPASGVQFSITDNTTAFLKLTTGAGGTWEVGGPVTLRGNAAGAGSTALTIGNNSTAAAAVLTFNAPTGQGNEIQFKRAGTNSWLFYDAASALFFFRDSVNSKMHMTFTPGAGAGGGSTELNTALKVVGNVGFYNTAPVAKPTGVAVTAAGIHAALVTLGLIAA